MAKKSSRLTPVVNIAEVREKDAARVFSEKMQHRDQVREQCEQLRHYRNEYKNNSIVGKNHTPETLVDMQIFLSRLNKSIDGVERQLDEVEKQLSQLSEQWQKSKAWTRSLEKAVERDLNRIEDIQARKEQKDNDEVASRTGSSHLAQNR